MNDTAIMKKGQMLPTYMAYPCFLLEMELSETTKLHESMPRKLGGALLTSTSTLPCARITEAAKASKVSLQAMSPSK